MIKRLNRRERLMLLFLLFLAIITIYYFWFYQPIQEKVQGINRQIEQDKNEYITTIAMVKKLPELEQRYQQLKEIENIVLARKSTSVKEILKEMEQFSYNNQVKIISFLPQEEEIGTVLNFVLEGSYQDFCSFLADLEGLKNRVRFETLRLQANDQNLLLNIIMICNKADQPGRESG